MPSSERDAPSRAALIGYGHFGRALNGLLARAGWSVAAWDPTVTEPAPPLTGSLREAVAGAAVVVIATPVDEIGGTVAAIRPLLASRQTVMDVGSVKVGPVEAMQSLLGGNIPWVATHPLFGPSNIARGDHPLRAVVCPNPLHPGAVESAADFYRSIGCAVVEMEPEAHDRLMARTHALAFFLAKGLLDTGAGEELEFTPPSFKSLAQTIDTVRSDAGHLFTAIERSNPFAAEARQSLLDALASLHARLSAPDAQDQHFDIPDMGPKAPELMETRDLIDEVDAQIVRLLVRRGRLASRAGEIKADRGQPLRDPQRERELVEQRRGWAREHDLSEESIADIFDAILRFSRAVQAGTGE